MKVLVLSTMVPFVRGGAEEHCDHLVINLRRHGGVDAEVMRIPFTWHPAERLVEEMLIARSLAVANADLVIPMKFPAYLVPHPNKVLWLLHQYRQAYDLWDSGQSNIPDTPRGREIRDMIRHADGIAFAEARKIYTIGPVSAARVWRYNGFPAEPLPHPLNDPELFSGGEQQGYVLAGGRVNAGKRQRLLVRALRYAPAVRLVIAGPPDRPEDAEDLRRAAAEEGVGDRLTLDLRFLPRAELARLVNHALAVAYLPFDEDSVGYVTMEAFHAGKPVLSVSDAGGVLEIVRNEETGYVCAPDPEALGGELAAVAANPRRASILGANGRRALQARGATWPAAVEKLLSCA
ncbi:MAG: glycosyltransferase family 4 protein [Acetobacteraceae bacterium]|nr:glycosyltransferase family 4 protein [Acetobacteraceae bacterium]